MHRARADGELAQVRGGHVVVAGEPEPGGPEVLGVQRLEEREEGQDFEDRGGRRAFEAEGAERGEV